MNILSDVPTQVFELRRQQQVPTVWWCLYLIFTLTRGSFFYHLKPPKKDQLINQKSQISYLFFGPTSLFGHHFGDIGSPNFCHFWGCLFLCYNNNIWQILQQIWQCRGRGKHTSAHCSTSINDDSILYNYTEATSQRVRWLRLSSTDQARTAPIIECALADAAAAGPSPADATPSPAVAAWQPPPSPLPRQLTRAHSQRYGITWPAVSRQTCTCAVSLQTFQPTGPARRRHAAVGGDGLSWALPAWRRSWAAVQATYGALRRGGGAYSGQMQAASFGKNDVILAIFWTAWLLMYVLHIYVVLTYLARGPPWPNIRLLTIWERADCY